ncbi:PREDICTED: protein SPT2 homolog [Tinamus guttatus]|uniref:protein SPT2 homolog n=1 Tax=Tinamus guttatus TaxID=94827 RepID=UPI00052E6DC7|nr:PREDICTED: protein SPT2 homolog [Tinamus guttatus]
MALRTAWTVRVTPDVTAEALEAQAVREALCLEVQVLPFWELWKAVTKKRYSLAVGPPKKVPKVKGVESAAVQAFLRRKEEEKRKKALEEKKKKEELLARRIELKHDRKARAMASRTKDNFYGYNVIPVEEKPRKRRTSENVAQVAEAECPTEDETEQPEYSQTESEHEQEEYEEKPAKAAVKPKAPPKSSPAPLNFTDLLRLAEKKQYEPVEIKVVKKIEERPRTAEELREREYLERKNKRPEMQKDKKKSEKEIKNPGVSSSSKKMTSQKESLNAKLGKSFLDKHSSPKGSLSSMSSVDKKSKAPALTEKHSRLSSSSKSSQMEKVKTSQNGSLKSSTGSAQSKSSVNGVGKSGSGTHMPPSKAAANGVQRPPTTKEPKLKKPAQAKPGAAALRHDASAGAKRAGSSLGKGGPGHPGGGSASAPVWAAAQAWDLGEQTAAWAAAQAGLAWAQLQDSASGLGAGPGRPGVSPSAGPGRPGGALGTPLKPKCTVVSETISSKNLVPRPSNGHMNGMRPFQGHRPGFQSQGLGRPSLPPISYKRQIEDDDDDDEYDSEMDDFIEDEGEPQEEISKHIREIFGYDRKRYKDESDYALRYMESSWREQQKEEARSLRLGVQEDLEELKREEEELKRKRQSKKLRTR